MTPVSVPSSAAIGVTVKSGWASVVLVSASPMAVRVLDSCRVELSDPDVPDSKQPYHAGFGTARDSGAELTRLVASVKQFGRRSVSDAIRRYRAAGHQLTGVGVVVGSLIEPERIANDHIRIHAMEGQLFRRVVEDAATRSKLPCTIWRERDIYATAVTTLKKSEPDLRATIAACGREVSGSWRSEQKVATLAAWLVLTLAGPPAVRGSARAKSTARTAARRTTR